MPHFTFMLMLTAVTLASAGSCARADPAETYLSRGFELAGPPAPGSEADQADIAILYEYQRTRTASQCAQAQAESSMNLESMFGPKTGVLTEDEVKDTQVIAKRAIVRGDWVTLFFKSHFKRARPYHEDRGIVPCISKPADLLGKRSYPSSYAVVATMLKEILVLKYPAKSEQIRKQAEQIGLNRILGGVHHPSDVQAGVVLGEQLAEEFLRMHRVVQAAE
jgi:acid phosphatase (class A)